MGEWSKRIGEEGESVVESLLDMIGWSEPQRNFDIPCVKPGEHSAKGNRKTHGIDKFFSYRTPLANRRLIHTVISVKSSTEPYPGSVKTLKSTFKDHFTDLSQAVDCFHRSEIRGRSNQQIKGVDAAENDVSIRPDALFDEFPESLAWVEQRIRDFRCKGDRLHEAAFLDDSACHEYIHLYAVDAEFEFDIKGATGNCRACLSFPRFASKGEQDAELEVHVSGIRIHSGADEVKPRTLRKMLLEELQDCVIQSFSSQYANSST